MLQSVEWCAKHNLNTSKVWLNNGFLSSFLCETCQVWPWPYEPPWTGVFGRAGPAPNEIHSNYLQTHLCKCNLILSILGPHELEIIEYLHLSAQMPSCSLQVYTSFILCRHLKCWVFCWGFPAGQYKYTFWRHCIHSLQLLHPRPKIDWSKQGGDDFWQPEILPNRCKNYPWQTTSFPWWGRFYGLSRSILRFPSISDGERGLWEEPTLEPLGSGHPIEKKWKHRQIYGFLDPTK